MVRVKPELGKVVLWYNHEVNPDIDWMAGMNDHSVHGTCSVKKGEQWVGNFWVRVQDDKDEFIDDIWDDVDKYEAEKNKKDGEKDRDEL